MNRETRKSLVERYLNAETDTAEESMLAEWFATHKAEPEELSVARLILAEHPEAGYNAAVKEFDAIMDSRRRRTKLVKWVCGAVAAVAVIVSAGALFPHSDSCAFDGMEIAQGIEHIISLDTENVSSVTARPKGRNIILTVQMNDGTQYAYLMTKDGGTSAISITAMSN